MGFLSALLIRSSAACSPGSLHIWLIIRKSESSICTHLKQVLMLYQQNRILMACVRNLGNCPCPRCLIEKEYIPGLGTKVDGQRRAKLRSCGQSYQANIEDARRSIYKLGYVVNSQAVDHVIGSESLTPAHVSKTNHRYECIITDYTTECICFNPCPVWAELFLPICRGSHARI